MDDITPDYNKWDMCLLDAVLLTKSLPIKTIIIGFEATKLHPQVLPHSLHFRSSFITIITYSVGGKNNRKITR